MKKYKVYVFSHCSGDVTVEADSPEEAKKKLIEYTLTDLINNAAGFEVDYTHPYIDDAVVVNG